MEQNKNLLRKILKNGGLFILMIVATFYFIFKDMDIKSMLSTISNINGGYLLVAVVSMCIFILCEALNIKRNISILGYKTNILKCINYSVNGFFFSSITPSASGGQPMQVYSMSKDNIKMSHSTLVLLIGLVFFQIVTIMYSLVGFFTQYNSLHGSISSIKLLFILGMSINIIVVAIFSYSTIDKIVNVFIHILRLFGCTKADTISEKIYSIVGEYNGCASFIAKNKLLMAKVFITTCIQIFALHSVPYWVYRSFGLSEYSIFVFIGLQSVLFIASSVIPLPGSIGVSESGFLMVFRLLFPIPVLGEAMLISRGISFYLFLLLSGVFLIAVWAKNNKIYNRAYNKKKVLLQS